ncbi:testis-specific serine/threonine-protein kinase 1-like isoform X1 [Hyposmocoma kahamanoa]|uniref:testis-specific serine/threonine-protein kinase 1-like isoform X1 n=1 Tax=Hyposmocoma kahamanoa TaxID=1477025 RepID=UPI000E6DA133|nr:testis-specific serine/threonine-protein kinase 1-like isoform X1 [Hyposmocoma kahamanoa]
MEGGKSKSHHRLEEELKLSGSEQLTLAARGYRIIKKVNEGSYAKVYLAEYRNPNKNDKLSVLACKVIDTNTAPKDFVKKFLPREIEMLIKLSHPHLVHTHSIFQRRYKYFIFMRYMEHGDLLEYILQKGAVQEDQARIWTRQLALAIQYMHELEIAHRDIKCENVLLTANQNAKLSDFGFSRYCVDKKFRDVHSETFCGSLSYTAPEILQGSPYYPKPTDVWSLGIVLFVMLNRAMPFEDKHIKQLYQAQINRNWKFRSRYVDSLSESCKLLVTLMLEPNHQNRIKIDQTINSEWIAMDSRLLEWTPQETLAWRKAREERTQLLKQVEHVDPKSKEKVKENGLPESSLVKNNLELTRAAGSSSS